MATTPSDDAAFAQDVRKLSLKKMKKTRDDEGTRKPSRSSSERLDRKGTRKPSGYPPSGSSVLPSSSSVVYFDNSEGPLIPPGYVPYRLSYRIHDAKGYSGGVDENTIADEGPCLVCLAEHPPCDVCYKFHHSMLCPYFYQLPKGARFSPLYELSCACGNSIFNEDEWICTMCFGTTAVVRGKSCAFCCGGSHSTYECPVDKAGAAFEKSYREKMLSREPEIIPPYLPY